MAEEIDTSPEDGYTPVKENPAGPFGTIGGDDVDGEPSQVDNSDEVKVTYTGDADAFRFDRSGVVAKQGEEVSVLSDELESAQAAFPDDFKVSA